MKKHLIVAILLVIALFIAGMANSQSQNGRFLIGFSPLNIAVGEQHSISQTASGTVVQADTTNPSIKSITVGLNLWVGYFATKNLCMGLGFGSGTSNSYTTFFRYYFSHAKPDSAKVDIFMQGNITFRYSITDNPSTNVNYNSYNPYYSINTSPYTISTTNFNYGLWLACAFHINNHASFETMLGFINLNQVQNTDSYTTTTYPYSQPSYMVTTPALKNTASTYEGALRLMVTYRI